MSTFDNFFANYQGEVIEIYCEQIGKIIKANGILIKTNE